MSLFESRRYVAKNNGINSDNYVTFRIKEIYREKKNINPIIMSLFESRRYVAKNNGINSDNYVTFRIEEIYRENQHKSDNYVAFRIEEISREKTTLIPIIMSIDTPRSLYCLMLYDMEAKCSTLV
jgi:hypothetical protein